MERECIREITYPERVPSTQQTPGFAVVLSNGNILYQIYRAGLSFNLLEKNPL